MQMVIFIYKQKNYLFSGFESTSQFNNHTKPLKTEHRKNILPVSLNSTQASNQSLAEMAFLSVCNTLSVWMQLNFTTTETCPLGLFTLYVRICVCVSMCLDVSKSHKSKNHKKSHKGKIYLVLWSTIDRSLGTYNLMVFFLVKNKVCFMFF